MIAAPHGLKMLPKSKQVCLPTGATRYANEQTYHEVVLLPLPQNFRPYFQQSFTRKERVGGKVVATQHYRPIGRVEWVRELTDLPK